MFKNKTQGQLLVKNPFLERVWIILTFLWSFFSLLSLFFHVHFSFFILCQALPRTMETLSENVDMAQPYYGAHQPTICPFVLHFPAEIQAGIQKCPIVRNLSSLCGNSGQKEVIQYQNFQQVKNNNNKNIRHIVQSFHRIWQSSETASEIDRLESTWRKFRTCASDLAD